MIKQVKDEYKKGVVEIMSHVYYQVFMVPLLRLQTVSRFREQLALELHKAQREQLTDTIAVIGDSIRSFVNKPISSKRLDELFWCTLTPSEMHKHPPQGYEQSLATAIPFINTEINNLCSRLSLPVIRALDDDYTPIIDAILAGIKQSQKGYLAPVDSIRKQLDGKDAQILKYKQKIKEQREYIDNLEEQIREYERKQRLIEQSVYKQSSTNHSNQINNSNHTNQQPSQQQHPQSARLSLGNPSNHLSLAAPRSAVAQHTSVAPPSKSQKTAREQEEVKVQEKSFAIGLLTGNGTYVSSESAPEEGKGEPSKESSSPNEQPQPVKPKRPRKPRATKAQVIKEDTKSFLLGQPVVDDADQ